MIGDSTVSNLSIEEVTSTAPSETNSENGVSQPDVYSFLIYYNFMKLYSLKPLYIYIYIYKGGAKSTVRFISIPAKHNDF